jgi:hypothetical protein
MTIDIARLCFYASQAFYRLSVRVLAAATVLGVMGGASAQGDLHDLMEGRGRDVSLPVSCGADIQPRFDASLAALHSFGTGRP